MFRLSAIVLLGSAAITLVPALHAQTPAPGIAGNAEARAERDVLATIDSFLLGLRTRDTALMARQMDSVSRFTLLRAGQAGARVMLLTPAQFMTAVTRADQPALDEVVRNPVVQVDAIEIFVASEGGVEQNERALTLAELVIQVGRRVTVTYRMEGDRRFADRIIVEPE